MSQQLKIAAYVVLLGCGVWFGVSFFKHFSVATTTPTEAPEASNEIAAPTTNQIAAAETNATDAATNASAIITNAPTNVVAQAKAKPSPPKAAQPSKGRSASAMMAYGAGLVITAICFGLLVAHDFSRFAAHRFEKLIFDEDIEGTKDPEYEEAEKVWANGQPLEAIQLMRDYLKTHPREQYVAKRIAEIYETDLKNYLAAALEYEEMLTKKLPAEHWGWSAIHLANLYSGKLNKPEQAVALLKRIAAEYGQTAAAKKARERLAAEGLEVLEPVVEPAKEAEPPPTTPPPPSSNLPAGFRPKK